MKEPSLDDVAFMSQRAKIELQFIRKRCGELNDLVSSQASEIRYLKNELMKVEQMLAVAQRLS